MWNSIKTFIFSLYTAYTISLGIHPVLFVTRGFFGFGLGLGFEGEVFGFGVEEGLLVLGEESGLAGEVLV